MHHSPPKILNRLYLGFVALFTLLAHWVVIDLAASHRRLSRWWLDDQTDKARKHCLIRELLLLHGAALLEVTKEICNLGVTILQVGLSAVLTLLLAEPRWQFTLFACPVHGLADW